MRRLIRRLLRLAFNLCLLAAALLGYMRYIEPYWVEVEELTMEAEGIEGDFRVVAFGDTHIGMGKDAEEMEELVGLINEQEPDAVVFLGDLFDDYSKYEGDADKCLEILSGIEAEYKYAVRGNHDVGGGAQWIYPEMAEKCGFTLLENDRAALGNGINIIGCADTIYFSPDIEKYITDGFDLLLAHEPDVGAGVTGVELQLSGHSHGGQIYLPFLKDRIMPEGARIYNRGRYDKPDGGTVYVNRGYGMSLVPLRLFSRPEVTVIDIKAR